MRFIVMFLIVCGCAGTDFVTGYCAAYVKRKIKSKQMRIGGVHKFCELLIMAFSIGLSIGLEYLGSFYNSNIIGDISATISSYSVFIYIVLMELISICENLNIIFPSAGFLKKLVEKLKLFKE